MSQDTSQLALVALSLISFIGRRHPPLKNPAAAERGDLQVGSEISRRTKVWRIKLRVDQVIDAESLLNVG